MLTHDTSFVDFVERIEKYDKDHSADLRFVGFVGT